MLPTILKGRRRTRWLVCWRSAAHYPTCLSKLRRRSETIQENSTFQCERSLKVGRESTSRGVCQERIRTCHTQRLHPPAEAAQVLKQSRSVHYNQCEHNPREEPLGDAFALLKPTFSGNYRVSDLYQTLARNVPALPLQGITAHISLNRNVNHADHADCSS